MIQIEPVPNIPSHIFPLLTDYARRELTAGLPDFNSHGAQIYLGSIAGRTVMCFGIRASGILRQSHIWILATVNFKPLDVRLVKGVLELMLDAHPLGFDTFVNTEEPKALRLAKSLGFVGLETYWDSGLSRYQYMVLAPRKKVTH